MGIAIIAVSLFSYPAICEPKLVICNDLLGAVVRTGINEGKENTQQGSFYYSINQV